MSAASPTYKPSEGKREEFRKYLERNGVMDALTKALVSLYEEPEKPEDALEYMRDKLASMANIETYKQMKAQLEEAFDKIRTLEEQIEQLKGEKEMEQEGMEPGGEQPAPEAEQH